MTTVTLSGSMMAVMVPSNELLALIFMSSAFPAILALLDNSGLPTIMTALYPQSSAAGLRLNFEEVQ